MTTREELEKIIKKVVSKPLSILSKRTISKLAQTVFDWHKQERKQWAKSCMPKEKEDKTNQSSHNACIEAGYNLYREEALKNIEKR